MGVSEKQFFGETGGRLIIESPSSLALDPSPAGDVAIEAVVLFVAGAEAAICFWPSDLAALEGGAFAFFGAVPLDTIDAEVREGDVLRCLGHDAEGIVKWRNSTTAGSASIAVARSRRRAKQIVEAAYQAAALEKREDVFRVRVKS